MSSRKVCTPVLVIALSLGTLSDLHALPLRGAAGGESQIQQGVSSRIFQEILEFWHDFMAQHHGPTGGTKAPEGSGICPNGQPPGRQGNSNGNTGVTGNTGNNGNNGNG